MNMSRDFDRDEQRLVDDLNWGYITQEEYTALLKELRMEYREAAYYAAENAYSNELERW